MSKLAIITCNNAENYGARLQCYALSCYLDSIGHSCKVIDYRPSYMDFKTKLWYWPGLSIKNWIKLPLQFRSRRDSILRHQQFDKFSQKYIPLTQIYRSVDELQANPPLADVYIAGSDQIWNTTFPNGTDPSFYLDFGDNTTKRISYAASLGIIGFKTETEAFVKQNLSRFDHISVREKTVKEALEHLGFKSELVCDPVFLLCSDQWSKLIGKDKPKEKFIMVYDMMDSKLLRYHAEKMAKEHGYKIYSIGSRKYNYADENFTTHSPNFFLWLIKNAEIVISNSFHACAFSLIFKKEFLVVNRVDGLNTRMSELLSHYHLNDHLISSTGSKEIIPINYTEVENIIVDNITRSKQWIASHLM